MEKNSEVIDNFPSLLKKQKSKKPLRLYSSRETQNKRETESISYSVKDVLVNVCKQVKAIQNADVGSSRRSGILDKYKKKEFLTVDMMPVNKEVHQKKHTKFEAQCVSDTQLINVIENAEIIDKNRGVTQEFDTTFCQKSDNSDNDDDKDAHKSTDVNLNEEDDIETKDTDLKVSVDVTSEIDTLTCIDCDIINKTKPKDNQEIEIDDHISDDAVRSPSPILNAKRLSPPLVFSLYAFEKFENLAQPIIEEHTDLQTAKNIINSQIVGSELFIPNHIDENDRSGPELNIIEFISINENNNVTDKDTIKSEDKGLPISPEIFVEVENDNQNPGKLEVGVKIEDEILFSSDEENEYLHKEVLELPITCALETSLYETSDVLEKNMYVGFQTASNKSIQISTDSFSKAKSILNDVVNEGTSLQDLVEIFDTESDKSKKLFTNLSSLANKDNITKENINVESNEKEDIGATFQNECLTDLEEVGKKDDILMSQVIPFKSIATAKLNKSISDKCEESVTTKRKFGGFKTASNKRIKLSDKALARCKKVFQDIDVDENFVDDIEVGFDQKDFNIEIENETDNFNVSQDFFEIKEDIGATETIIEEIDPIKEDNEDLLISDQDFLQEFEDSEMLFEKPNINIPDSPAGKVKDIFHDTKVVSNESGISNNLNKEDENIFKIPKVAKKSIKPKESLPDVKNNELNVDDFEFAKPSTSKFIGFKTAANKEIKISSQALEKVKNFYKEIDEDFHTDVNNDNSKQTEEKVGTNTEDLFAEEFVLNEDFFKDSAIESKETKSPVFKGFQTANKKAITISEKALQMSKKLFADITDDNDSNIKGEHLQGPSNDENQFVKPKIVANNKENIEATVPFPTTIDPENITADKKLLDAKKNKSNNVKEPPVFKGFQTASNKKVTISAEALAKSKKVFQGINISQADKETTAEKSKELLEEFDKNNVNKFVGFKTASSKPVNISADALAKTKVIFNDFNFEDKNDENDCNKRENIELPNEFVGFHTASNKEVKISEEALVKSKEIFNDIEFHSEVVGDNFVGFKTANNKKIKISEDALAKSKQMFDELEFNKDNLNEAMQTNFVGFKTANNNEAKISEKALAKSKQIFNDIEFKDDLNEEPEITTFVGFKTASNKKVKISDEALAKSKSIFKDIHDENSVKIAEVTNKDSPVFKGFQTANNKQVKISEKAVEKSRKLFQDIDVCKNYEKCDTGNVDTKVFCGFQTASNKKVEISENALAMTKKIFDGIEFSQKDRTADESASFFEKKIEDNTDAPEKGFTGFQTANNKKVLISEQAIARTKTIFNEELNVPIKKALSTDFKLEKAAEVTKPEITEVKFDKANITKEIIDTQVLNDFQDSLNTEDFCKNTPKSKRSGSPILSCPRAKKRKFETPYRNDKKVQPVHSFVPPKLAKTYKFKDDYKKNKVYTLEDLQKLENNAKLDNVGIDPYVKTFNFDTLFNFEFVGARNDYNDEKFDVNQIKKLFLESVNKKIVPDGWLDSHIKLIIWKLISYEVKFPRVMKNVCSVKNIMDQLKYRYDRELYNVERPILRKILEKDEVPSRTMVLCVAAVYVDDVIVSSAPTQPNNIELLLTDGWYCVRAVIDRMLNELVCKGSIVVGSKIATSNAELINCEQGIAPWEDTSTIRLKLHGNSVRPVRLGPLGARSGAVACGLRARAGGGRGAAAAAVARGYPPLAKREGVILSERMEWLRLMKQEEEQQALMEKIYEELEKELADQESQDESYDKSSCLESGSQIAKMMKRSRDPDEYRSHLTASQTGLLEEYNQRKREKKMEEIRVKFQEKLDKCGMKKDKVSHILKVRLVDFRETERGVEVDKGFLSIWNPSAAVMELMTEGSWVEIVNFIPTGMSNSEVQLSAGRQTIFKPYIQKNEKYKLFANTLKRKCYEIKELAINPNLSTDYNEIDTVGIIFEIEPSTKEFDEKKQSFQNVFLADADKHMICVNFWGGLKKFGYENFLDTGQIVTCVNLQKRAGNSRKSIPQYRVTELTYITKTPKDKRASELTNELSDKLSKIKEKYCEDCVLLKNNYSTFKLRNVDNVSPYRFGTYNTPKRLELPMNCDTNLNLTGLDFESSFTTQMSPEQLLRKKRVKEKIEKLKMYGEPPPLSSIHIINKSKNASATYKSPLILKDKVASCENTPRNVASIGKENLQNDASPVGLNRTFVKRVNPVKLNFSNSVAIENDLNDSVDHFGGDFEASPPLSLDSDVVL